MPEGLGEEGPHDCVAAEQQASAQEPQGDVELFAGVSQHAQTCNNFFFFPLQQF